MKGWVRSIRTLSGATAVQPLKMDSAAWSAWALNTPLKVVPEACLPERRREVEPAVEVGADGGGVERRPVLERDLVAQLEGVGPAFIALGPFGGQQRGRLTGGLVDAHEAFEHLPGDAIGLDVGDQGGIQPQRFASRCRR